MVMAKLLTTAALSAALLLSGCVLAPKEREAEQERLAGAGGQYARAFEQRTPPELPPQPTWRDVLRRSFHANGDLEAAYHEWAMAVHRIDIEAAWPNAPVAL